MSWIIKQVFWVPHRFRYGILVAGGWGNVGDIRESTPTIAHTSSPMMYLDKAMSVLTSLTAAAPFNGTSDQNLAVAYIAVFSLVFLVCLY